MADNASLQRTWAGYQKKEKRLDRQYPALLAELNRTDGRSLSKLLAFNKRYIAFAKRTGRHMKADSGSTTSGVAARRLAFEVFRWNDRDLTYASKVQRVGARGLRRLAQGKRAAGLRDLEKAARMDRKYRKLAKRQARREKKVNALFELAAKEAPTVPAPPVSPPAGSDPPAAPTCAIPALCP